MVVAGSSNNVLICGTTSGKISFREVWSLEEVHVIDLSDHGGIKCLSLSEGKYHPPHLTL